MNILRFSWLLACCGLLVSTLSTAQEAPALTDWLYKVVSQHPQVMSQRSGIDVARAQQRGADKPIYNPELELEYENTDVNTRTAGISQTIDWGDKRTLLSRIAGYELEGKKAAYKHSKQNLASELMLALAQYQISAQLQKITLRRVEIMSRFQAIAQRRFDVGDLPQIERDLAELANAEAGFQLADSEILLLETSQQLKAITGSDSKQLPMLPQLTDSLSGATQDIEAQIDQLPEMRQARAEMDASRLQVQLKELEQRPDPTIGLRAGKEGKETLTGITLAIPLYVRNNFRADVDAANALYVSKQQEALSIRRQLLARVQAAALRYRINYQAWKAWLSTGKQSLDQQTQLLTRLWKIGEVSTTDYLVQLQQILDTQASAVARQGQLWEAWVKWLSASGELNQWLANKESIK